MRERRIWRETEDEGIRGIPPLVSPRIIRIEPRLAVIPIQVEDVRIAIGVGYVCCAIRTTAPAKSAQGCI